MNTKEQIIKLLEKHRNAKSVYEELGVNYTQFTQMCFNNTINYSDYIFINFNKYINTYVGKLFIKSVDGRYFTCDCQNCNRETKILKWKINKPKPPTSCKKCNLTQTMQNKTNWTGYEKLTGHQFAQWRNGAKRRNIRFEIKPEDVWNIFLKNNQLCPITNEKLTFRNISPKLKSVSNISIDRIINNDYYHTNNILIVHKDFNKFHHVYELDYVLQMSKLIINPEINKGYQINKIPKWLITQNIKGFETRNNIKEYSISEKDLINQFNKQNGLCYYTGLRLEFGQKQKDRNQQTASIDRLDNAKGYTTDNIVWCHKHINLMKKDLTVERFMFIAKKTVENLPTILQTF